MEFHRFHPGDPQGGGTFASTFLEGQNPLFEVKAEKGGNIPRSAIPGFALKIVILDENNECFLILAPSRHILIQGGCVGVKKQGGRGAHPPITVCTITSGAVYLKT